MDFGKQSVSHFVQLSFTCLYRYLLAVAILRDFHSDNVIFSCHHNVKDATSSKSANVWRIFRNYTLVTLFNVLQAWCYYGDILPYNRNCIFCHQKIFKLKTFFLKKYWPDFVQIKFPDFILCCRMFLTCWFFPFTSFSQFWLSKCK